MIDLSEESRGRHHVCRGIWGGVRYPLFFWLVRQQSTHMNLTGAVRFMCVRSRAPHPPPQPCLHTSGSVTLADVTAGCCSHLP